MIDILTKAKNILDIDSSVSKAEKLASTIGGIIAISLINCYFINAKDIAKL